MLIENSTIKPGDIVSIMLVTGQEIIAKLLDHTTDGIAVSEPLNLNVGMDQAGNPAVQLVPMMISSRESKAKVPLLRSHYILLSLASDSAKAGYIRNTTGLEIATPGALLGVRS